MNVLPRALLIGIGALALTTVSIKAVDQLSLSGSDFTASLHTADAPCPEEMSLLTLGDRSLCVDTYEASPAASCPYESLGASGATEENLAQASCMPVSEASRQPWVYVSLTQAQQLCARAGKRVPSATEWYAFGLGIKDESACVLDSGAARVTGTPSCVTPIGVYDVVGNVWEWVAAEVRDGTLEGTQLPPSGYVHEVTLAGLSLQTQTVPDTVFGSDYVTTNASGTYGVVRGGFYDSGSDGGLFALNAAVPNSLSTQGIGFRCVQDAR